MSIGIHNSTASVYYVPDKSLSRNSSPKVLTATYGDGYEQRIADGINSIKETYALTFATRTKEDIDDIVTFLDSTKGVTSFNFGIPNTNNGGSPLTVKAVCEDYSTNYQYDNFYSLNVKLRRVYEP